MLYNFGHKCVQSWRQFIKDYIHLNTSLRKIFNHPAGVEEYSRADPGCAADSTRAQNNPSEDKTPAMCRVKAFSRPQLPLDLAPGVE